MANQVLKPNPSTVQLALGGSWSGERLTFAAIWISVIEPMLILHYPPFRAADDEELERQAHVALLNYLDGLAEFAEPILKAAWRAVLRDHRRRDWPTLGEIRDACLALAPRRPQHGFARQAPTTAFARDREAVWQPRFPHRIMADQHMVTPDAQGALLEGWAIGLWDFVATHGRGPDGDELVRIAGDTTRRRALFLSVAPESSAYSAARTALSREDALRRRFLREHAA